ncbi:hypothetical protein PtA15_1A774 [Puccinia triticina]|uniref:AAA+ ATPase domain-containing protein n=1 Tax=Puccinia triticina TaxID=208348 RepID=A0ABY7CAL6_9BASI|nr:uncharacterized protein PtA15_1A774 [Puccinia triticina]WAQ81433.1 hypothetical protein PtA15_1A774 [Puccinia triticina]
MSSSPDGPTSPEDLHIASERVTLDARYEELHPLDTDGHNSVSRLLSESSLSKVNQYLDDLAVAFGKLSPEVTPLFRDSMWHNVLSRKPSAHTAMASFWRLDRNLEAEFVRLVFFHQHPMLATTESPMSMNKMLEVVTTSSSDLRDHIAILREGYSHEYLRKEIIVKPILKSLSNYAEEWVSTKYLAPYTALVGPSMCGKTRLLMELSKSICVVYISLRPRGSTGEPPRSVLADEFQLCHKSVYELVAHYYRLLAAIFDVVAEFFSRQYAGREEEDRLLEWYTYNHEFGGYLTSRVGHTMEELGKNEWSASAALTKKIEKLERSTRFIKNPKLKVMLAFDEARALVDQQTREAESLLYFDVLRRVLSEVPSNLGFFAILADRSLTMADYYPNLRTEFGAPTLGPKELYEPIYAISTFDSKVPPSPPTTWDELLSPPRLFSYGTPFFRIYAEGAEKKGIPYYRIATTVQQMALNKLLAMPRPSQELSESNVFALLGCTIQPPMHKAGKINSELVSSHMAQCLYLSPPSARVISEYPSQFTLSMAANQYLASEDCRLVSCIKTLTVFTREGLISTENSGELAARIILLRAMQQAMSTSPITTNQTHIPYGCSVRLVDFLEALTGIKEADLKLDMNDHVSFCGVTVKNESFSFKLEGPEWNSQSAGVKLDDSIPYLFILLSFKTTGTNYTLPPIPQRGSLILHGLDSIKCLTPEISGALEELISVCPDIREFMGNTPATRRFIESIRPGVYSNSEHGQRSG